MHRAEINIFNTEVASAVIPLQKKAWEGDSNSLAWLVITLDFTGYQSSRNIIPLILHTKRYRYFSNFKNKCIFGDSFYAFVIPSNLSLFQKAKKEMLLKLKRKCGKKLLKLKKQWDVWEV